MVNDRSRIQAGRMRTTPTQPQYRSALARVASFIGALQQVRRGEPDRAGNVRADDFGAAAPSVPMARTAAEPWALGR
jgi:hypothetical protein